MNIALYCYRLVNVGSSHLQHSEAARTDIKVWMPSMHKFVKVSVMLAMSSYIRTASIRTTFRQNYISCQLIAVKSVWRLHKGPRL